MSPNHLKSLLTKSAELEHAIEKEQARPLPDTIRLLKLKKLRLLIKDRISRLLRPRKRLRKRRTVEA